MITQSTYSDTTTQGTAFAKFVRRAFLAFMLVGVAAAVAFSVYSWQREKRLQQEQMAVLAGFLSAATQAFLDNISNSLLPLGQLLVEMDVVHHPERARSSLLDYQHQHPEIGSMAILTPEGVMIINTAAKPGEPLPDYRNAPDYMEKFKFALNDPYPITIGRTEYGKILKEWRFPFRHTVRDANGTPLFMVQAAVPLQDNGRIFVVGIQPPPQSIIGLLRSDGFQQARWPAQYNKGAFDEPSSGPLASMIASNPGMISGNFTGNAPWSDAKNERFGAFYRLPRFDMFAYISIPSQLVWKGWIHSNGPLLVSFVVFMGIFGTIAFRVTRFETLHSKELLGQARRDPLTGLPNRAAMEELLSAEITLAEESEGKFAVAFLDLDRFKDINDTLGHDVGDQLLIKVTSIIRQTLRRGEILSRLGGDEFLIIFPECDADACAIIIERLVNEFQQPLQIDKHELRITSSIGIAIYPENGTDLQTLLKHADTAMYAAKNLGRNSYAFYEERLGNNVKRRIDLEHQLRTALNKGQFQLHYQPVINMTNGKIIGAEALLRWEDDKGVLHSPAEFIQVAEDSGLILPIGEWVLNAACQQAHQWAMHGYNLYVAVNLSPRQFQDPLLAEKIGCILQKTQLDPKLLEIEITESAAMHDPVETTRILNSMKAMELAIAIDDFGTGYSSLSYLKRIPADKIKIDKSFVDGIGINPDDTAIVRAILALAHTIEKQIQAEGIESREQYEALRAMGCESGQGYWMSRPVTHDALIRLLQQQPNYNNF